MLFSFAGFAGAVAGNSKRQGHPDRRSFTGLRFNLELAVNEADPLLHPEEPQPLFGLGGMEVVLVEGFSVIGNLHADGVFQLPEGDIDAAGAGVLGNVREALLGDTEEDDFLFITQAFGQGTALETNAETRAAGEAGEKRVESGHQAEFIEHGGPQFAREAMYCFHGGGQEALGVLESAFG